uniref:Secreted protein n=1 Tax=Haemonchus placei TaxID=6290 RepID=A0A0N4WHP1_HAEPC
LTSFDRRASSLRASSSSFMSGLMEDDAEGGSFAAFSAATTNSRSGRLCKPPFTLSFFSLNFRRSPYA